MGINKLLVLFLATAAVTVTVESCAGRIESQLEVPSEDSPVFNEPTDSITYTIEADIIQEEATKTSLAANGHTVNWTDGDKIHVVYIKNNNNAAVSEATLSEGAGTPNGKFSVRFDSNFKRLDGAFYDGKTSADISQKNSVWYATTSLSGQQTQTADMSSLSGCDLKVAEKFTAGKQGGDFAISFRQKNTLLNFDIKPTEDMASDGQKIRKVTFDVPSASIAGTVKLPIEFDKIDQAPSIDQGRNSVSVAIEGDIPFTSNGSVNVRMYVLPTIKKGNAFTVTVYTDDYTVTVNNIKAAQDFKAGYRYHMNLDLPDLVSSGKAVVVKKNRLLELSECGIWDCENLSAIFSVSDGMQYGYNSTKFRMVVPASQWDGYKVVFIEHPSTMTVGETVSLKISKIGDTGVSLSGTRSAKVLRQDNGKYWLEDTSNPKIGYIIMSN